MRTTAEALQALSSAAGDAPCYEVILKSHEPAGPGASSAFKLLRAVGRSPLFRTTPVVSELAATPPHLPCLLQLLGNAVLNFEERFCRPTAPTYSLGLAVLVRDCMLQKNASRGLLTDALLRAFHTLTPTTHSHLQLSRAATSQTRWQSAWCWAPPISCQSRCATMSCATCGRACGGGAG